MLNVTKFLLMKRLYTLVLLLVSFTFCKGQNKINLQKKDIKPEAEEAIISYGATRIAQDIAYQLDNKKSKLLWTAPRNRHNGFILFNSGTLGNFIAGMPTRGMFSIDMNSMRSIDQPTTAGRNKVNDKLRSDDFFAVSKYPTATMLVKQILPEQNPNTFKVSGDLTIKGVTQPIEFTTIMKHYSSTITATANIIISRAKWNIDHQPDATSWNIFARVKDNLIDDEIPIRLELVFTKN